MEPRLFPRCGSRRYVPLPSSPGAGSVLLAFALALLAPSTMPAQDAFGAGASAAGTSSLSGMEEGVQTCLAMPSWAAVDGRIGAATVARDGRRAVLGFTRNGSGRGNARTSLRVVDLMTGQPLVTVELGDYGQVTDVWPSYEGTRVWVAAEEGGRILTVDSRTGELLMVWKVGRTSHQAGAVSGSDRYLYVTNREAGTLTLIDRATVGARTVELGRGVASLDVSERGGRTVWVANRERDELVEVSGRTGEVLARMPSGGQEPVHVRVRAGTDEIWVAHRGSAEIVVVDGRRREITGRIALDSPPGHLAFDEDGSRAYVSLPAGDRVVAVDADARSVLGPATREVGARSLAGSGCGLARLLAGGACPDRSLDPWLAADGLPVDWVSDEDVVGGPLCGSRQSAPPPVRDAGTGPEERGNSTGGFR